MSKIYYLYGSILLVFGVVFFFFAGRNSDYGGIQDKSIKEQLADPEKIPEIDWNLLYQFDYKTGEGPDKLKDLDGKVVKIPGFIVPLSDNYSVLDEFLLVPDGQSCIHVPPPPPNLIVTVELRESLPAEEVSNPSWVIGVFRIQDSESQYGGSAFRLEGFRMERFMSSGY